MTNPQVSYSELFSKVNFQAACLQERFSPNGICFGCGPKNDLGLKVRSFEVLDSLRVLAEWKPSVHHQAFPGVLNGGIIGALLDCHSNWTAAWLIMKERGQQEPPCTVTSDFHVKLRRPTSSDQPLRLIAHAAQVDQERATIEAVLESGGKVTATCTGTFVAVKPGHPAFHRW